MAQYRDNTITNAIIRLDFANPIQTINTELAAAVRSASLCCFEIPEKNEIHSQEIEVSNGPGKKSIAMNDSTIVEWVFKGKSTRKELKITKDSFLVEVQEYSSFEELKRDFLSVFSTFKSTYGEVQVSRMGMRYVDQIQPLELRTSDETWFDYWKKYVDERLLGGFAFTSDDNALARHMNSCVMNYGDYSLTFQYGMFNPDFPAVAKKSVFVLDTDVYSAGLLNYEDIVSGLDAFHTQASVWFEKSITNGLRELLGINSE